MKNDLLKYILHNGVLEPNKLGITEVFIDDDESIIYGSKNSKTIISASKLSIEEIEQEIEDCKFFLKIARSEIKQAREEYEAVKHLGSPKFNQKVKEAKEFLYDTERRIYVNKYIAIPYFEFHLRVKKGKKELIEEKANKPRRYFGLYFKDPVSKYVYTVVSENSGYLTLSDVETGKNIKVKEEGNQWLDFIDVTDEIEKEIEGITAESSGYENNSDFSIKQYEDNVFLLENEYSDEKYRVVVGEAFNLDELIITSKNKNIVLKGEKLYKIQMAIQNHVSKYNPKSKEREIKKFLNKAPAKAINNNLIKILAAKAKLKLALI